MADWQSQRKNLLCYGDNLVFLRDTDLFPDECVDLIYLDPPFNSQQDYNVLFKETAGTPAKSPQGVAGPLGRKNSGAGGAESGRDDARPSTSRNGTVVPWRAIPMHIRIVAVPRIAHRLRGARICSCIGRPGRYPEKDHWHSYPAASKCDWQAAMAQEARRAELPGRGNQG